MRNKQAGAATLFVTATVSLLAGIVVLSMTEASVMDIRMGANEVRAKQAFQAAEAGLQQGMAFAQSTDFPETPNPIVCTTDATTSDNCPTLAALDGMTDAFNLELRFSVGSHSIKVESTATGVAETHVSASVQAYVFQDDSSLFATPDMPPPWVIAGCVTTAPTGSPSMILTEPDNIGVWNGADCSGEDQQGEKGGGGYHLSVNSTDGSLAGARFECKDAQCAWDYIFALSLDDAKARATAAAQIYKSGTIPCGASPGLGLYILDDTQPVNKTEFSSTCDKQIGSTDAPVVVIVPSESGCPKFNGGITVYGIVYYENKDACASNGWGGATVYGTVIWEGNVSKPNANSVFHEVDYSGDLDGVFGSGIEDAIAIPGTWWDGA